MSPAIVPRLGVVFLPTQPPENLRALARAADAAGLDEFWVWEDCFKESGVTTAAVALASTERIRVGIGLMPAPLRNVALTAMEIATLDRIFPGRLIAGIGHGVQDWMGQVGARAASPMGLLREYAIALRRLLDGEKVSVAGRYVNLDDVALDWPPLRRPALMIGAKGVKSLALAGELGDGALLHGELTDAAVQSACAVVQEAAAGPGPDIFGLQLVATGPEAAARLEAELTRSGQPTDLGIGVAGDAPAIAASLRRWAGFGVTSVTIQPTIDEPDLEAFINFLGREVRPLLS